MSIFINEASHVRSVPKRPIINNALPLSGRIAIFTFFTLILCFIAPVFAQMPAGPDKGSVSFDLPVNVAVQGGSGSIALGNFDLGQTTDIASLGFGGLALLYGDGQGGFSGLPVSVGINPQYPILSGDFTGDRLSDLVIKDSSNVKAYVLINVGEGRFSPPVQLTSGAGALYNPALGDINKDGALDIIAVGQTTKFDLYVFQGDGAGNFSSGSPVGADCIRDSAPITADFNRDGHLDLACVASSALRPLAILLGDGAGGFGTPTIFPTEPHFYSWLVTADFNNDGNADVGLADGAGNVDVLLGDGLGNLSQAGTFKAGDRIAGLQAADLDADGSIDLVAPDSINNRVVVLLGTGSGAFEPPLFFAVGKPANTLALADFDKDGAIDIAVGTSDGISLLHNNTLAAIGGIFPTSGGNTGSVSARITGSGFVNGATVKLVREGVTDIVGSTPQVIESGRTISTTFNLRGATLGSWNVVLTNPDGSSVTLKDPFIVDVGLLPKLWVELLGPSNIRHFRETTYQVIFGNSGNVDAYDVALRVTVPRGVHVTVDVSDFAAAFPDVGIDWKSIPMTMETDTEVIIPAWLLKLGAGSQGSMSFSMRVDDIPPGGQIPMAAELFPLDSTFSASGNIADVADSPVFKGLADGLKAAFAQTNGPSPSDEEVSNALGKVIDKITDAIIPGFPPEVIGGLLGVILGLALGGPLLPYVLAGVGIGGVAGLVQAALSAAAIASASFTYAGATLDYGSSLFRTAGVVTAIDPNEKVGSAGAGTDRYVSGAEPQRYAVLFENLETATAPAQEVVIRDQLDLQKFDLNTFSLGPIKFGSRHLSPLPGQMAFNTNVDLRPAQDLIVRIEAALDPATGIVSWKFKSLDPKTGDFPADPLAGFLPPNQLSPEGEGRVLFTVMPKAGQATGTAICNEATIVFDGNEAGALNTPNWCNKLDNSKPISQVSTLADNQASTSFEVVWSGSDEGAGIKDYTIYVSENGGPFTAWLANTADTSASFSGQNGKTYAFYSVARDQTGNNETAPGNPDASTTVTVVVANLPPTAKAGSNQTVESTSPSGASVTLDGTASADPDNNYPLTYSWTGPFGTAEGPNPTVTVPLGVHTITLTVTDSKGASSSPADTVVVTVQDTAPPSVTLEVASGTIGDNGWYRSDVTVRTSGTDAASGIESCTADQFLITDSPGTIFNGSCKDKSGNAANAAPFTVKRDATPPETVGNANVAGTQATVTLTASDNLSGIAGTSYRINGGGLQSYTGPFVLNGAGNYTLSFFSTDAAGNEELAKALNVNIAVPPVGDACLTPYVLDNFNRANGKIGSNWGGVTGTFFYRIAGNRLDVQAGGPIHWNLETFGTNQAAFVTLSTADTKSPAQGLLLKVQSGSVLNAGAIAVVYDARAKAVRVSTLRLGALDWTSYGNTPAIVNAGDKLAACTKDNGEVRIYTKGALLATVTLNPADQAFFNKKGGKIGLWSVLAPNAYFDDFGGSSIAP